MIQLSEKRIPKVVIGLTLFWLGIVEAFFWTGTFNLRFLPLWFAAILAGAFMAKSSSDEFKDLILTRLCYDKRKKLPLDSRGAFFHKSNGVISSLGVVPFKRQALPCATSLDVATLLAHLPRELSQSQFEFLFANVFPINESSGALKLLTSRAVRTLCHEQAINHPAGIDRHGGRSLLTHSLLVTALLLHRASDYKYLPTRHTPTDPNFKLDPADPLLPVIGFLHDIGKLTKLVVEPTTRQVQILPNHSGESIRIASDFTEYWSLDISTEDRLLLQDVISYSYSINELPVKKSTRAKPQATSDRLWALVDFLWTCDLLASNIEMGAKYDFSVRPEIIVVDTPVEDIESIDVYDEFLNFITIHAQINALNGAKSVGFRYKGMIDGKELNLVLFDERKFADEFSKFLDRPNLNAKEDKRSVITGIVLKQLDENEILVRDPKDIGERKAKDCLYKITFKDPSEAASGAAITFSSGFAISLDGVERLKGLDKLPNCHCVPSFENSIYGNRFFSTSKVTTILDEVANEELGIKTTGQEKSKVTVTTLANSSASKPAVKISKIRRALKDSLIVPTIVNTYKGNDIHIVGYNNFFESLGVNLTESVIEDENKSLTEIGIRSIKSSVRNPGDFIFLLSGSIYQVAAA